MRRDEYLRSPAVATFIGWLRQRVRGDKAFPHSYTMLKPVRDWRCNSLWEAHERYEWNGLDFAANQAELDCLAACVRRAVREDDPSAFVGAAHGILRWGGVTPHNAAKLRALGEEALPIFREASRLLDPSHADTSQLEGVRHMNSGWTKVYSLMLDGFPIYDGRVGAAMGYSGAAIRYGGGDSGRPATAPLPVGSGERRSQARPVVGLAPVQDADPRLPAEVGRVQRPGGMGPR